MTTWIQNFDPFNNIILSALVAAIPVFFLGWALLIKKMKGHFAALYTLTIAALLAVFVFAMPLPLVLMSGFHGILFGLFPICWIIISAVFLYNVTVKSGQFEVIKNFMASITEDRRLQAILIAFSFGSFLEGVAGMGAPVAITAAMLAGLGFNPLYAAGICLLANTAPVAYGAVGVPITTAATVSGLPEMAISQLVGRSVPLLGIIVPLYLIVLMSGWKKSMEVLPAILVSGISFAIGQWYCSNYINSMLPNVFGGIISIICVMILLKFWKPKSIWKFKDEPPKTLNTDVHYTAGQLLKAWSPFIILTLVIIAWGFQPVKDVLDSVGLIKFTMPYDKLIISASSSKPIAQAFSFNYLSASGTAIVLSAFLSLPLIGLSFMAATKEFFATLNKLKFVVLTIGSVLGFAYITNNSSMSYTMALAMASTGVLFPFFSPILGWLGVFLTGSDASSNALFCKLQANTAHSLGIDPLLTVAANASGGGIGKMVSPQSLSIGAAVVGLAGKESDLFRFSIKHSFILLFIMCIVVTLQTYLFTWIVPVYQIVEGGAKAATKDLPAGYIALVCLAILIAVLFVTSTLLNLKNHSK